MFDGRQGRCEGRQRRRVGATLLTLSLAFAGCRSSADDRVASLGDREAAAESTVTTAQPAAPTTPVPTTTTTAPTTTTEPAVVLASGPSAGCDQPEPTSLPTDLVTADGVRRTFRVALPSSYDQRIPAPLVFDFHGLGSEGFQEALVSGVDFAADRAGYIAVIPDGAVNEVLGTRLWNLSAGSNGALASLAVDDVAFTTQLLDTLESQFCVDTGRIFSMGLSNGGFFSTVLACEVADRIAAVATVAGITHPDDCDPVRPVPVLHFHGTADAVVPYDGRDSVLTSGVDGTLDGLSTDQLADFADELFQPIEAEVGQWATTNGCSFTPEIIEVSSLVERRVYTDCTGADVEFYVIEGGGHTWPGSLAMAFISSLGLTTFDVSATQLAFEWFADHPMPAN